MELSVKKASSKQLILSYKRGYGRIWVAIVVSLFVASLIYWFAFAPSNQNAWIHQGPLLKRVGNGDAEEVLFRMPDFNEQKNRYIPLDEPFISYKEDRNRYELILFGQTSEKLEIYQIYERKIGTYKTKEEAKVHYNEIIAFLKSSDELFDGLSKIEVESQTNIEKVAPYSPFILALFVIIYFLLVPKVRASLMMDRTSKRIEITRSSVLFPQVKRFDLSEFESAELKRIELDRGLMYEIILNMKGKGAVLLCKYKPPYKDDKQIASLAQHTRVINWWNDDELIEKYGDDILKKGE